MKYAKKLNQSTIWKDDVLCYLFGKMISCVT